MANRTSRLTEIFESELRSNRGTLNALVSAIGGRILERVDPRTYLSGRAGTPSSSLLRSFNRSIFGAGYSATAGRTRLGDVESTRARESTNLNSSLSRIDAKMSIVAKNSFAQRTMAYDIRGMSKNIQLLTKTLAGKSERVSLSEWKKKTEAWESSYESRYKKERESEVGVPGGPGAGNPPPAPASRTSKIIKGLGLGLGVAGIAGAVNLIYKTYNSAVSEVYGAIESIANFMKGISSSILDKIDTYSKVIDEWKTKWDNFNVKEYLKSITPDQLGGFIDTISNFLKGSSDITKGLLEKIPADKLGDIISSLSDSFLNTFEILSKKLVDAVSTMDTGEILKLATAGGLMYILFGKGGGVVGGAIGSLLGSLIPMIFKNPIATGAVLAALGLYKLGKDLADKAVDNLSEDVDMSTTYGSAQSKLKYYGVDLSQVMNTLNEANPEDAVQFGNLIQPLLQKYNDETDQFKRKELMDKILQLIPENFRNEKFKSRYESLGDTGTIWNPNEGRWVRPNMINEAAATRLPQIGPVRQSNLSPVKLDPFWENYSKIVGDLESGGDYSEIGGANDAYLGKYQMGSLALKDAGLLKDGNVSWRDPNNWVSGYSLERFLSDPELQERAFRKYTEGNLKTLMQSGAITANSSEKEIQGVLAASHLVGAGAVSGAYGRSVKNHTTLLSELQSNKDAFNTSASKYYQAFLSETPPVRFGDLADNLNKVATAAADTAREGFNIIQNFAVQMEKKAQEETDAVLSSFDSNTLKDIMNPLLMRTTLSYM